jgi:hypothetical protein
MRLAALPLVALLSGLGLTAAHAQGTVRGAQDGAARGEAIAGPVGAVVGSAIGAAVGTANSLLGIDRRERFRIYAAGEHRPSFRYEGPLRVGAVLPPEGVVYYDVPPEFALKGYNYTIVNDHPVLVEPGTRRVVEVID